MFHFNLKPGHPNPADGLLESVGAFTLSVNLVPGHPTAMDGLLVAQRYFETPAAIGGSGPTTFSYIGSGGFILAGAAVVTRTFSTLASGGLVLGGAATVTRTYASSASGGLVFGSSATVNFVPATGTTFSYVGTGGMVWGGEALTALLPAQTGTPGGGGYLNSPRRKRKPPLVPQFDYAAEEELLVLAISHVLAEY